MSQHHNSGRQGQSPRRRNNNSSYGKQGRASSGNRRYSKGGNNRPFREPRPAKLSFWQKILKMIGLHKPAAAPAKKTPVEKRTNTRVAKGKGEGRSEGRAPISKAPVSAPRLYVGNLSYEATESDLEDLFKGIGGVRSVEVIYNPRTHKSKGYAFVEMQFMDDAVRAVEVLHDQPFMGRLLTVSAANERQENNDDDALQSAQSSLAAGFDPDDVEETRNS